MTTDEIPVPTSLDELWRAIRDLRQGLDRHLRPADDPIAISLLKIGEEYGEATSAYIGAAGLSARKGTYASHEDIADELTDVIITAMIALDTVTQSVDEDDPGACRAAFDARLAKVLTRTHAALREAEMPGSRSSVQS